MRRFDFWKVSTVVLAAALVLVVGDGVVSNEADARTVNMQAVQALGLLEGARSHLWRAPKDQDGHRAKALAATRGAVLQLRIIAFGEEAAKQFK